MEKRLSLEEAWNSVSDTLLKRLEFLYGPEKTPEVHKALYDLCQEHNDLGVDQFSWWDQQSTFLITYGQSIRSSEKPPLQDLLEFLTEHVQDSIEYVHLLPFYPYTSDDGFSVVDYRKVNPELGDWEHIEAFNKHYKVVYDAVVNHVSASSHYMQEQCLGNPDFQDFCKTLDPKTDVSQVVRPRNLPLLSDYKTHKGVEWFWTTFSRDQIDLNFENPKVLLEITRVLLEYARHGASMIRLDAIPYLWKEIGTNCIHRPEVHQVIKLFREIYNVVYPNVILLSETNVPHKENISYFGNKGDEAQVIYNFSLPPLVLYSIQVGDTTKLTEWAHTIEYMGSKATYLNITATHDGIGVRPVEGILNEEEKKVLLKLAVDHGGAVGEKKNPDGSTSPYELNVTYFDAVNNPKVGTSKHSVEEQVKRFLVTQAIALSFMGIPGVYIHSLLGSRNDYQGVERTGVPRSINRKELQRDEVEAELQDSNSLRSQVFTEYKRLLGIRQKQLAFHPDSPQKIWDVSNRVFALLRGGKEFQQCIVALHNISSEVVELELEKRILEEGLEEKGTDLLSGETLGFSISLAPYQVRWIEYPPSN
jgi:sucrose phosphorylase